MSEANPSRQQLPEADRSAKLTAKPTSANLAREESALSPPKGGLGVVVAASTDASPTRLSSRQHRLHQP
ncbi:MAG: hypothetical protein N2559_10355 [Anaerolineae bacterium]|nr:hypothetical protein [Anaerolineae bacterium]